MKLLLLAHFCVIIVIHFLYKEESQVLSDETLVRAKKTLASHPTYLELLDAIWPSVKDFDFSGGKRLRIPMPKHFSGQLVLCDDNSISSEIVCYSHKAIKTVLTAFGMEPYRLNKDKDYLTIRQVSRPS